MRVVIGRPEKCRLTVLIKKERTEGITTLGNRWSNKRTKMLDIILDEILLMGKHKFIRPHTSGITRKKQTRKSQKYKFKKYFFKNAYFPRTMRDWNALPESTV